MTFKELKQEVRNLFSSAPDIGGSDYDEILTEDIMNAREYLGKVEEIINYTSVETWSEAMRFLSVNDPTLRISLGMVSEGEPRIESLDSIKLADILLHDQMAKGLDTIRGKIEEAFDKYEDKLNSEL